MHDLVVVTACTRRAGLLAQLAEQLQTAGIPLHVESLSEMPNNVGNLGLKVSLLRKLTQQFADYRKMILCDAWDFLFYGTAEEVISKIPDKGVLLAAERNCWPDAYLAPYFTGETPWRFPNGGFTAGSPFEIAKWLNALETHPAYHPGIIDQQWLGFRRLDAPDLVPLDEQTDLVYCMMKEAGELQFKDGRPHNTVCNTFPNFIHFNGKTDPTMFLFKHAVANRLIG